MRLFIILFHLFFISNYSFAAGEHVLSDKSINLNPQLQWSRSISPVIKNTKKISEAIKESGSENNSLLNLSDASKALASAANYHAQQKWTIQLSDKTLYRTLRRWAQDADFQLLWQIEKDYPIEASVEFNTHLRGALEQVMAGVALTDYPIQAIYNPSGRVLRVVRHLDDGRR